VPGQDEASDLGTEQLPEPADEAKQQRNESAGDGKQGASVSIKAAGDGKQEASVSVKAASADEYDLRRPPAGKVWHRILMHHKNGVQLCCRSLLSLAHHSRSFAGQQPI
jgi:hypothetical protein